MTDAYNSRSSLLRKAWLAAALMATALTLAHHPLAAAEGRSRAVELRRVSSTKSQADYRIGKKHASTALTFRFTWMSTAKKKGDAARKGRVELVRPDGRVSANLGEHTVASLAERIEWASTPTTHIAPAIEKNATIPNRGLALDQRLISAEAPEGRKLIDRNEGAREACAQLQTQQYPRTCAVGAAASALSLIGMNEAVASQEQFFRPRKMLKVATPLEVMLRGLDLPEIERSFRIHGAKTLSIDGPQMSIKKLRDLVKKTVNDPAHVLVVNYGRAELGQAGIGHYSPIGAYDQRTDRALVLDVASYKYAPVWVRMADLHQAIATVGEGGAPRGVIHVWR
jgi:hypothetical protein